MEKLKHGALALTALFTKQVLAGGNDLEMTAKEADGTFRLKSSYWPDDYESSGTKTGCKNWYSCNSGESWSVPSFTDASFETDPAHAWFCSDDVRNYN